MMAKRGKCLRRKAFTLIELLVVVAVILILMGISLKIMGLVSRKTATARTVMVLEQVKNALNAYYAAYGSYPAVYTTKTVTPLTLPANPPPTGFNTSRGLTAYLMTGREWQDGWAGNANVVGFFNPDARQWNHYFKKLVEDGRVWREDVTNSALGGGGASWMDWTNSRVFFRDGWDREIRYQPMTSNDVQGYRLWSLGPNGVDNGGGGDDIIVTFE